MPVLTLRDTDPKGELSAFPSQSGVLDEVMGGLQGLAGIVGGLRKRKRERRFEKTAEEAVQTELDKLMKGEKSKLDMEYDPTTGSIKFNIKQPRPSQTDILAALITGDDAALGGGEGVTPTDDPPADTPTSALPKPNPLQGLKDFFNPRRGAIPRFETEAQIPPGFRGKAYIAGRLAEVS